MEVKNLLIQNIEFLQDPSLYSNLQEKISKQSKLALAEYYKDFKNLFDNDHTILIEEGFLKSQFENICLYWRPIK